MHYQREVYCFDAPGADRHVGTLNIIIISNNRKRNTTISWYSTLCEKPKGFGIDIKAYDWDDMRREEKMICVPSKLALKGQ
jgi:hypothetical protein